MCGIWGIIQSSLIEKKDIHKYLNLFHTLNSRGPDKDAIKVYDNVLYGFKRLAIHDLSPLGDQPFEKIEFDFNHLVNIHYSLICNGEIYNFKELIKEYNLQTISDSDCEVILPLFIKFNRDINKLLSVIKGEYAFSINIKNLFNSSTETYIVRSMFGQKGLYYLVLPDKIMFGSLLKSLPHDECYPSVFPVGSYMKINSDGFNITHEITRYYTYPKIIYHDFTDNLKRLICKTLVTSCKRRLSADRPVCVTLSGGLDSSIVAGITKKVLNHDIATFSIGLEGSADLKYAEMVAKHINSKHTSFIVTVNDAINAIDRVIRIVETWDITTIRASIWQLLLAEEIEKTEYTVVLNGDGMDELLMGYRENWYAPSDIEARRNLLKRMDEIHMYDVLRVEKAVSNCKREPRPPALDDDFANLMLSIDPKLLLPIKNESVIIRQEKSILRQSINFCYPDLLPPEILYRSKEAFSDGVSDIDSGKLWYQILQDHFNNIISDSEFNNRSNDFQSCLTKESYYYKKKFTEYFGSNYNVIPGYWLHNWTDSNDPSARSLDK